MQNNSMQNIEQYIVDALAVAYPDEPVISIEQYAEHMAMKLLDAISIGYILPESLKHDVVKAYGRRS